nr:hypothetical protein P5658_04305 [Bacillus subtilis]
MVLPLHFVITIMHKGKWSCRQKENDYQNRRKIGDDEYDAEKRNNGTVSKFELIFTNWEGSQVERSRNVSSLSRYAGSSKKRMPGMRSKASINSVLTVIIDLSERSVFTHVSNDFTAPTITRLPA